MKVGFRAVIYSNFHKKFRPVMLTNYSILSGESDGTDDNNLFAGAHKMNAHNTVKVQSQRGSEKFLSNLHKPMLNLMVTASEQTNRRTGRQSQQKHEGDIQLKDMRAGGINAAMLTLGPGGAAQFTVKSQNNAKDVMNNETIYSLFA